MPYANQAYERRSAGALPPRDVEAAAFEFVNRGLQTAGDAGAGGNDRVRALSRNRKLWSLLLTDIGMTGNALPPVVKQDIVSIGAWSIDYSIKAMSGGLSLAPLIAVNRDMIEGLRASPNAHPAGAPVPASRLAQPISA